MSLPRFQSLNPIAALPQLLAVLGTKRPTNGLSPQGSWYSIKNVSDTEAEISIYDEIGYFGISANDFIRDLSSIKAQHITLRINSAGGDVFDGKAIYNAIRRNKSEVTAYVDGMALSAASFIAMGANRVVMSPHATMMIHDAQGVSMGAADDMRELANVLDKESDSIAAIYAEKAGGTVEEWRGRMKATTWMSDREAVDLGLADAIDGEEPTQKVQAKAPEKPVAVDWAQFINKQMEDATLVA